MLKTNTRELRDFTMSMDNIVNGPHLTKLVSKLKSQLYVNYCSGTISSDISKYANETERSRQSIITKMVDTFLSLTKGVLLNKTKKKKKKKKIIKIKTAYFLLYCIHLQRIYL